MPNALSQLVGTHWLQCPLHGIEDCLVSQVGALVF